MTVPTGPARLTDIQTEFGGSNPIGLDEYYAGGAHVVNPPPTSVYQVGAIPTVVGSPIAIGNFLGVSAYFLFNDVISANYTTGYNLAARATAAGWNGTVRLVATVTINGGVTVTSPSTATPAFRVDNLPAGSTVTITNNGTIVGRGGGTGVGGFATGPFGVLGGTAGTNGGIGLSVAFSGTKVNSTGIIAGGGGGGGGGGAYYYQDSKGTTYGAAGSGGGGGAANGPGAGNGTASGFNYNYGGVGGTSGSNTSPGVGGFAGTGNPGAIYGGAGGAGGEFGQPGYPGGQGGTTNPDNVTFVAGAGGLGGNAGLAVSGGSNIQWMNHGSVQGNVDSWGIFIGGPSDYTSLISSHITLAKHTGTVGAWTPAFPAPWYWNIVNASTDAPAGNVTFYMIFDNLGVATTAHLYGAVDNSLVSMTVNGSAFAAGTTMGYGAAYATNSFTLAVGMNVISVTLNNATGPAPNPAGFTLRLRRTSDNLVLAGPTRWFY